MASHLHLPPPPWVAAPEFDESVWRDSLISREISRMPAVSYYGLTDSGSGKIKARSLLRLSTQLLWDAIAVGAVRLPDGYEEAIKSFTFRMGHRRVPTGSGTALSVEDSHGRRVIAFWALHQITPRTELGSKELCIILDELVGALCELAPLN